MCVRFNATHKTEKEKREVVDAASQPASHCKAIEYRAKKILNKYISFSFGIAHCNAACLSHANADCTENYLNAFHRL